MRSVLPVVLPLRVYVSMLALPPDGEAQVLALLRARLDRFALPRRIVYVPHFAQTPTAKIDRPATLQKISI